MRSARLVLAIVGLAACSSSGSGVVQVQVTPSYPEGLPTPQVPDAAADAIADSSAEGDGGDAEGGIVCPPLDTTACGIPLREAQAPCPTYADVRTWCLQGSAVQELSDPCDGLLSVALPTGVDSEVIYYFDSETKVLMGIAVEGNAGVPVCIGGLPVFNPSRAFAPDCASETTVVFEDAGACANIPGLDGGAE